MNRRLVVSILAMILVLTMILSLVLTVIPVRADGVEQASCLLYTSPSPRDS